MSGFDNALRSQQMVAGIEMEAGARRNQAIQGIGNAAMGVSELLMRKAESDTRIAAFQQEQQLNQYKLQQLMQLDQAGMSRYQVDSARMQTEAQALQLEEAKLRLKTMERDLSTGAEESKAKLDDYKARIQRNKIEAMGGPEGVFSAGKVIDDNGNIVDPASPQDLEQRKTEWLRMQREQKYAPYGGGGRRGDDPSLVQGRTVASIRHIDELIKNAEDEGDQESIDALRTYRTQMIQSLNSGGSAPPSGRGDEPAKQPPQQKGEINLQQANRIYENAIKTVDWSQPHLAPFQSEEAKAMVAGSMGVLGDILIRNRGIKPEIATAYVDDYLKKQPEGMGLALLMGGYSDDVIRHYYESVRGLTGQKLENVMKLVLDEGERLQRPMKESTKPGAIK